LIVRILILNFDIVIDLLIQISVIKSNFKKETD